MIFHLEKFYKPLKWSLTQVSSYGDREIKPVSYSEFVRELLTQGTEWNYGAVNTKVKRNCHILALDCDSVDAMLAASHWVKTELELIYEVVESSEGHYWIFVDKVGPLSDILEIMSTIPGVDRKFLSWAAKRKAIHIRTTPKISDDRKNIYTPEFQVVGAEFKNDLVRQWVGEFREYFNGPDYRRIEKSMRLTWAIRNGTVSQMAQDPSFVL